MDIKTGLSLQGQLEAIRNGEINPEQLTERIAELRQAIEEQKRHEQETERIAEDRRAFIAERNIKSRLQNMIEVER